MTRDEAQLLHAVDKAKRDVGPCAVRMNHARDAYCETPDSLAAAQLYLRESRRYVKAQTRKADAMRALWAYRNERTSANA